MTEDKKPLVRFPYLRRGAAALKNAGVASRGEEVPRAPQAAEEPAEFNPREAEKSGPAVLFVCTGNICRSPMAYSLFQLQLKELRTDWENWLVDSAGTWAEDGMPVSRNSMLVMARRGVDIANHRARTVTAEMVAKYDLILTMEQGHKEALQVEFPFVADRVYMLSEMAGRSEPVKDPIGGPLDEYLKTSELMETMINDGMDRILKLAEKK